MPPPTCLSLLLYLFITITILVYHCYILVYHHYTNTKCCPCISPSPLHKLLVYKPITKTRTNEYKPKAHIRRLTVCPYRETNPLVNGRKRENQRYKMLSKFKRIGVWAGGGGIFTVGQKSMRHSGKT
jgi:hypothetical protein